MRSWKIAGFVFLLAGLGCGRGGRATQEGSDRLYTIDVTAAKGADLPKDADEFLASFKLTK